MRSFAAAVVVVALAAAGTRAHADDIEEARRQFAAGQEADARREWQTAIAHFLRANELVPHPYAVYNIARDYEQLDQLREAARWYARYIELANDAGERAKIDKRIAELRSRPSKIAVHSTPDAARVAIDGTQVGVTPYAGVVTAGSHRVVLDKDGQHDQRDLTVEFGEPADLAFTLAAGAGPSNTAMLVVTGPANAAIFVDGILAGRTPAQLVVAPGPHVVSVEMFGAQPFLAQPDIPAGGIATITVPVAPGSASFGSSGIKLGFVLGAIAGVDANTTTGLGLGELGFRIAWFDLMLALGSMANDFASLYTIRISFLNKRVTPFASASGLIGSHGLGGQLTAGLRWDVSRGERRTWSLLVEGGYRSQQGPTNPTTFMGTSITSFPVFATFEGSFWLGAGGVR